jgi:hypothetical protein
MFGGLGRGKSAGSMIGKNNGRRNTRVGSMAVTTDNAVEDEEEKLEITSVEIDFY